ncbi:MAG: TolC family protein [Candidatus Atribacteria bacterium]|nr:TolC family protein [Candidatus Atribacteria bacterium]
MFGHYQKRKRFNQFYLGSILFLVMLFMLPLIVFAEETNNHPLPLSEAVKIALENGIEMKKAQFELQQSELNYKKTKADLLLAPSALSELSNETALLVAQRNYEITRSSQIQIVEEAYYNILKLQRSLVLAQENINRSQKQLENVRAKYSLGMVAQIDVISAEYELSKAQSDRLNVESNLQIAKMNFNQLLGRDLNNSVELASELVFNPSSIDLKESIEYALKHRLEIKKAEEEVVLKTKEVQVNTNDYTPIINQQLSQVGLQISLLNLENIKNNIQVELKQNYETLRTAERAVPLQEKSLTRANEYLKIAEARYEAGVITSIELIDARNEAYQAENAYLQAVFDYNVAKSKFYNSLGMSLEERMKVFSEVGTKSTGEKQGTGEELEQSEE